MELKVGRIKYDAWEIIPTYLRKILISENYEIRESNL